MIVGSKKSKDQKFTIKNIKTLYESWEKVIELFDDYFRIASEAKFRKEHAESLKIWTTKELLQILPIALASYPSKSLLTEIRQIIYSLYRARAK